MTSITIRLPHPPRAVKQNARSHWRAKAAAVKKYRKAGWAAAMAALQGQTPPRWVKARMEVKAYFKTMAFPDPANFMASLKAAEDGMEDAGIVQNDRGLWPERPTFAKDAENPRIEITITPEP